MKVNTGKTGLLVVSDALSYNPVVEICDAGGARLRSGKSMKILGFHMSDRPGVGAHVEAIRRRFRQRYWVLFHLKKYGFNKRSLQSVQEHHQAGARLLCSSVQLSTHGRAR